MSFSVLMVIVGAIFVVGGIKGYSIPDMFRGQLVPRTPPNPSGGSNASGGTGDLSAFRSPITQAAKFARVDQGVDYSQSSSYTALGSGTVERISSGWAGGTGKAVYIKLDNPVSVNGRTYDGYYVAETTPLVHAGQKVNVGQPIASGGSAELGFLINGQPTPLVGGLGSGTQQTQAGNDFYSLVKQLLG